MSVESVMPSNYLILCHPLLLLPSIFPSIRVFSKKLALCIRWPKYWRLASAPVLPINIQSSFHLGLTVWSPCYPRDVLESSPATSAETESWTWRTDWLLPRQEEVGEGWSRRLVIFILNLGMWLQLFAWIFVDWIQIEHFTTLPFSKILHRIFFILFLYFPPDRFLLGMRLLLKNGPPLSEKDAFFRA